LTTIIALEHGDSVTLAADSRAASGNDASQVKNPKIFANGNVIFGVAGSLRVANLLRHIAVPRWPDREADRLLWDGDVDAWVTLELLPAVSGALHAFGEIKTDEDGHSGVEADMLVVAGGRIYEVAGDFSWNRNHLDQYAIGSGAPYALGALEAGADTLTALSIAARHDTETAGPFSITTDKELLA
jgi:ATP-dependent protease HslVU (ClpYQ) peptidase subunit